MTTLTTAEKVSDAFAEWLARNVGQHKWIVARRSKKRVGDGYDLFLTEKKFSALLLYFEKETAEMESPELRLTEPNPDLAKKRKETWPGMAFWAGTGPADRTCRECTHWRPYGYLSASGMLKDSPCDKYTRMMNATSGPAVPHYAKACKYFEAAAEPRPVYKPK